MTDHNEIAGALMRAGMGVQISGETDRITVIDSDGDSNRPLAMLEASVTGDGETRYYITTDRRYSAESTARILSLMMKVK